MRKTKDKKIEVREIVYCQDDEKSFGDVFIYEPENIEEQNLGNLFIVGELKDLPRNCSYIMNVLASKIKKEFYANTKRTAEEGLEAGLAEANKTLADLADQGNGEYVGRLSMICGTYRNNKFYLSQIGKIKSLLIRDGRIIEIVKEENNKAVSANRAFNNIASGELADGDLVLFATDGLFNVFSLEKLRQMGSSMKLDDFSTKLQDDIEEEDSETVSALLIEIEGEKKNLIQHSEIALEEKEAHQSLEEVLSEDTAEEEVEDGEAKLLEMSIADSQEETAEIGEQAAEVVKAPVVEEIPSPVADKKTEQRAKFEEIKEEEKEPVMIEAQEDLKGMTEIVAAPAAAKEAGKISLSDIIKEYEKMESKALAQDTEKDKSIEQMVSKKESNNFEDLDEQEEKLHKKVISGVKNSIKSLKSSEAKAALSSGAKKLLQGKKEYKINGAKGTVAMLRSKKVLIGALLLVLAGGSYYYNSVQTKNKKIAQAALYQSMLDDSKAKMDQAEVDLISGSEAEAGKNLLEARNLASKVKDEYDGLDSQADEVIAKAQVEIDKIDKVDRVDDSAVVASFENENIAGLSQIDGTYYVVDGKENTVYKVDTENAKIEQAAKAQSAIGNLTLTESFQNQEILLSDGSAFLSYSAKNNSIQKLNSTLDTPIQDFASYGRFLYLLSPSQNQVYKYQKTTQGLDSKAEWIKSGDIKSAVSIAIDQYVYILTQDGQVKKYYTGDEYVDKNGKKFAIDQPSDAISNAAKIYTLTDQKYLYITEPAKNRVLMFDKATGSLYRQYVGSDFATLKGIVVDADEKNMLVLCKNKVVKISLEK